MPIEPVKIPQNVYIEDRIVGPLTLRQVIISAIGCGFSYAMFSMISKAYGGGMSLPLTIMVWIPGALSIIFAFVKFNDLTMFQMVLLTIERMSKAPVRVWTPRKGITLTIRTAQQNEQNKAPQIAVIKERNDAKFAELSAVLDQQSAELDHVDQATPPASQENQTLEMQEPVETQASNVSALPTLPVNKSRISVSPLPSADGETSRSRVSLFHDIHPA